VTEEGHEPKARVIEAAVEGTIAGFIYFAIFIFAIPLSLSALPTVTVYLFLEIFIITLSCGLLWGLMSGAIQVILSHSSPGGRTISGSVQNLVSITKGLVLGFLYRSVGPLLVQSTSTVAAIFQSSYTVGAFIVFFVVSALVCFTIYSCYSPAAHRYLTTGHLAKRMIFITIGLFVEGFLAAIIIYA